MMNVKQKIFYLAIGIFVGICLSNNAQWRRELYNLTKDLVHHVLPYARPPGY